MPSRKGVQLLAYALGLGLMALVFGFLMSQRSASILDWTYRLRLELRARDVVESALAEATNEYMKALNDPGHPYFAELRRPWAGPELKLSPGPELNRTRSLIGEYHPDPIELRSVSVKFSGRQPIDTTVAPDAEWNARVTVKVEVAARPDRWGRVLRLVGEETRELRAAIVSPPGPFDRVVYFNIHERLGDLKPLDGVTTDDVIDALMPGLRNHQPPPTKEQIKQVIPATVPGYKDPLMPMSYWARKATILIEPWGNLGPEGILKAVGDRTDGVTNGVVFVKNTASNPLRLRNWVFRGRAVLVVAGALEMADVTKADERFDLLTVIAFGPVSLSGNVQACVVFGCPRETSGSSSLVPRQIAPGTQIRGGLAVTCGPPPSGASAGACTGCPYTLTSPTLTGPMAGDRIFVSVAPEVQIHRIWTES